MAISKDIQVVDAEGNFTSIKTIITIKENTFGTIEDMGIQPQYVEQFLEDHSKTRFPIQGKINLVVAPMGCGKSTYARNKIIKPNVEDKVILYLVDTESNLEDVLHNGDKWGVPFKRLRPVPDPTDRNKILKEGYINNLTLGESGCYVCTFQYFGKLLATNRIRKEDGLGSYIDYMGVVDILIVDEVHNLYSYRDLKRKELGSVLKDSGVNNELFMRSLQYSDGCPYLAQELKNIASTKLTYAFSGTPDILTLDPVVRPHLNHMVKEGELRGWSQKEIIQFDDVYKIPASDLEGKTIVYTGKVSKMRELVIRYAKQGKKAVPLWSRHAKPTTKSFTEKDQAKQSAKLKKLQELYGSSFNDEYKILKQGTQIEYTLDNTYTEEQEQLAQYIKQHHELPEDVDILIINSAWCTGYDLRGITNVILDTTESQDGRQARGRARNHLERLYITIKPPKEDGTEDNKANYLEIPEEYLGLHLTTDLKEELAHKLNIRDKRNKLLGWQFIKKQLGDEDRYSVTEKRLVQGTKRPLVHVITKIENN